MRPFDRDLIRGEHYGQRSCEPHQQAEHMAAPTNAALVKKVLANSGPKADILIAWANVRFWGDCVAKLGCICQRGVVCIFAVPYSAVPDEGVAASTHRYQRLTHRLCWTGRRQWRWTAKKLDEPPQVLRGCGKQDLVPRTGQASQSKPVEPEDTLHMRKSHLDLLALAV